MRDARYDEYVVAAAYVDQAGSAVLADALDRGAAVTLVMPRRPNVYEDANKKALAGVGVPARRETRGERDVDGTATSRVRVRRHAARQSVLGAIVRARGAGRGDGGLV